MTAIRMLLFALFVMTMSACTQTTHQPTDTMHLSEFAHATHAVSDVAPLDPVEPAPVATVEVMWTDAEIIMPPPSSSIEPYDGLRPNAWRASLMVFTPTMTRGLGSHSGSGRFSGADC